MLILMFAASWVFSPDSTGGTTQEWLWAVSWGDSAVVLVEDGRPGFGYTDMRVVWVDLVQHTAAPDSAVSLSGQLRHRTDPRVAGDASSLLAAWTETLPGGESRVMGRRLRGTVGPATPDFLLPMGNGSQYSPALAFDPVDQRFLVLAEADSGLYHDLWFRLVDAADTGAVHPLDPLHTAPRYTPRVAWIPGLQRFGAVWVTYGPSWNSQVQFAWISPDGGVDTFRLVAGDSTLDSGDPDVAGDASDTVAVVYRWLNGSASGIHLLLLDSTGRALGPPVPVNTDTGWAYRTAPHVRTVSGGWVVTWADDRDGVLRVYARTFAHDGTPLGAEQAVYPAGWPSEHPFALYAPTGTVVVAEVYRPGGEEDILATWIATGDTLNLIRDEGTGDQQDLAALSTPDGLLAAWSDQGTPSFPGIFLRRLGPTSPLTDPVQVDTGRVPDLGLTSTWLLVGWQRSDSTGNTLLHLAWMDSPTLTRDTARILWVNPGEWSLAGLRADTGLVALVHQANALVVLRASRTGVDTFWMNDTTLWQYPGSPRWLNCSGTPELYWKTFTGSADLLLHRTFSSDGTPDTLPDTLMTFTGGLYSFDVACADSGGRWVVTEEPTGVQLYHFRPGGVDTLSLGSYHTPVLSAHPGAPRNVAVAMLASQGGLDQVVWAVVRPDTVWGPFPVDTPQVEVMQAEPHVLADTAGFWVVYTSNELRQGVNGRVRFFPWPTWVGRGEAVPGRSRLVFAYHPLTHQLRLSPGGTVRLRLMDVLGRQVVDRRLPASRDPRVWTLPRGLRPGIYVLMVSTEREKRTLKIMLERNQR